MLIGTVESLDPFYSRHRIGRLAADQEKRRTFPGNGAGRIVVIQGKTGRHRGLVPAIRQFDPIVVTRYLVDAADQITGTGMLADKHARVDEGMFESKPAVNIGAVVAPEMTRQPDLGGDGIGYSLYKITGRQHPFRIVDDLPQE